MRNQNLSTPSTRRGIERLPSAISGAFVALLVLGAESRVLAAGEIAPMARSITTTGTQLTETFSNLANSGTAQTAMPSGWGFAEDIGTNADGTYDTSTGPGTGGNTFSFHSSTTDTANNSFGSLTTGTNGRIHIGAAFLNATGSTLQSFKIDFTGEQWRYGGGRTGTNDALNFSYKVISDSATSLSSPNVNTLDQTGWTYNTNLNFNSIVNSGTSSAVFDPVANASYRQTVSATIFATVAANQTLLVRWTDLDITGNDDSLAIDNFHLTAETPEPGSALLVSAGVVALLLRRSRAGVRDVT